MANIVGKPIGEVGKAVAKAQSRSLFTSPLNKGWRAKILLDRASSPMLQVSQQVGKKENDSNHHYARPSSYSSEQRSNNSWKAMQIEGEKQGLSKKESIEQYATDHTQNRSQKFKGPDGKPKRDFKNEIIIVNDTQSPYTYLTLQNRPDEIDFEPLSHWTSIKSMGRNTPFQLYTGSEDTINLEISWYSVDSHREDVINKCRLLESWSKSDGYTKSPPVLQIIWGSSGIFDNASFVLVSAAYKLTNFQDGVRRSDGGITDLKLLPNCATQKLSFKRVSSTSLKYEDIIPADKLKITSGIKFK